MRVADLRVLEQIVETHLRSIGAGDIAAVLVVVGGLDIIGKLVLVLLLLLFLASLGCVFLLFVHIVEVGVVPVAVGGWLKADIIEQTELCGVFGGDWL